MIIQRYLLRLILVPFLAISALLTILLLAEAFGEVLTRALSGTLPGAAVGLLIGYQVPGVLKELMPGAFFLASVLALGQLSASSERVVLQSVGYSDARILGLVLGVATLITGLVFVLTLVVTPWAARAAADLETALAQRPAAELIQPGEFAPISADGSTLYAESSDSATGELVDVFVAYTGNIQNDGNTDVAAEQRLISADRAEVTTLDDVRYLLLKEGELLRDDGSAELEKTLFTELYLRLEVGGGSRSAGTDGAALTDLLNASSRRSVTEGQQRLLYPFTVLVFAFWAVALTRYTPRSGKNAAVLPAVILYLLYNYFTRTVNASARNADGLPLWANYWWVHLLAIALALLWQLDWRGWLNRWRLRRAMRREEAGS